MTHILLKLQSLAAQLPAQQLEEVVDFAEFLAYKAKNGSQRSKQVQSTPKELDLPAIKGVKFVGDPLLRREDLYDDMGR